MLNGKKLIVRVALLGAVMMASGCALGVDEALIDNIDGLSIARENAADRIGGGEFPGKAGQGGGSANNGDGTGGNTGGGTPTTADNGGGGTPTTAGNGGGGKHPNSGGGNGFEGDPDVDPGKGNEHRSGKSKGKNQDQD